MTGEEIDVRSLPPVSGEELAEMLVGLIAKQADRIEDLKAQLEARNLAFDQVRAEQDAALWRQGASL